MAGSPQTDAASIKPTVLPVPESIPQTWQKNGRAPMGSTSAEAKDAASRILAASLCRRIYCAALSQDETRPRDWTARNICRKLASPSNSSPAT